MSGIVKSVKKVFRKATKTVRKVAPFALAAAAIVYTGGAAMGASWAQGGWGAATKALTEKMGATGMLGDVLSTSLTHAGYGAALGGVVGAATGDGLMKGMEDGAVLGGVTGAVSGGLGMTGDVIGDAATEFGGPSASSANINLTGNAGADPLTDGANINLGNSPVAEAKSGLLQNASMPVTNAANVVPEMPSGGWATPAFTESVGKTGLGPSGAAAATESSALWNSLKDSPMAGHAIGGVGGALVSGGERDYSEAAKIKAEQAQAQMEQTQANYQTSGKGMLSAEQMAYMQNQPPRPSPEQRFDPRSYGGRYIYNPTTKQVDFVPNQAA